MSFSISLTSQQAVLSSLNLLIYTLQAVISNDSNQTDHRSQPPYFLAVERRLVLGQAEQRASAKFLGAEFVKSSGKETNRQQVLIFMDLGQKNIEEFLHRY